MRKWAKALGKKREEKGKKRGQNYLIDSVRLAL
jgi:hypothetical protein